MIRLAKTKLILFLSLFLLSCFGPVKELKYQIEDSWDESEVDRVSAVPLKNINQILEISIKDKANFDHQSLNYFEVVNIKDLFFYASHDGLVICLNFKTFEIIWEYNSGKKIITGLSSDQEKVFFVDEDGFLNAINLTGSLEWKSFVGQVFSLPLITKSSIVVKTSNNSFVSSSLIDGSQLWTYQLPLSPLSIRSSGKLSFRENVIYAGVSSGKIIALNSDDGSLIWETTYSQPTGSSDIERSNDTLSQPIVDKYFIYTVASKGNIAAISLEDGSVVWSRPLSSFAGMSENNNNLYVTHKSGSIYALSKDDNKILWRNSDLLGRGVSVPNTYKNSILVSDFEGYIHFIDMQSGIIIGQIKVSDSEILKPIIDKERDLIYLVSSNGELTALSIINNKTSEDFKNDKNSQKLNDENQEKDDKSVFDRFIFWD